jgi:class 3 adenylate cyclase/CHASE2 domain-containing sensor protein
MNLRGRRLMPAALFRAQGRRPLRIMAAMPPRLKKRAEERRFVSLFAVCMMIGSGVTVAATLAAALGLFAQPERVLLDLRFRWFDHHNPAPSKRVVHVDIDDSSIRNLGRWPWHRGVIAKAVDELHHAGASVVAFDVLFDKPQEPRYIPRNPADPEPKFDRVNDDAALAESFRAAGGVLLPVTLDPPVPPSPLQRRIEAELEKDPTLDPDEIARRLGLNAAEKAFFADRRDTIIRAVIQRQLRAGTLKASASSGEPRSVKQVLPRWTDPDGPLTKSPVLADERARLASMLEIERRLPRVQGADVDLALVENTIACIPELVGASAGAGFVNHQKEPDGVVRNISLWLRDERRLYPQLGLAAACELLKVPLTAVVLKEDETILPAAHMPDGAVRDVHIPMLRRRAGDRWISPRGNVLVAWPTATTHYLQQYGGGSDNNQHIAIGYLADLGTIRPTVPQNQHAADVALFKLVNFYSESDAKRLTDLVDQIEGQSTSADPPARHRVISIALSADRDKVRAKVLADVKLQLAELEVVKEPDVETAAALKLIREQLSIYAAATDAVKKVLDSEEKVRSVVAGSACFIGYTATGLEADMVPTSLEAKVPGVMIHGVILNSILTDHFFRRDPLFFDLLLVLLVGLAATLIATTMTPVNGLLATVGMTGGYFLLNGWVLFDRLNLWAIVAAPIGAATGAWVAVTVYRLISEQKQKDRIKKQFRNYVSPSLVELILENPHRIVRGQHELTCLFTDFAGFTSIAERLGTEATATLLNKNLSVATDVIMQHRGTVNKYLGDGIMAFWGAPLKNADHAIDACRTVLRVIEALKQLESDPELAELPRLHLRCGISTGLMKVDDFGAPPLRSDYTVIGNEVNFASRLESANKQFGTQLLLSQRTHEIVSPHVLTRTLGRVMVMGKEEPVEVFELLATREAATDAQREMVVDTAAAIAAFQKQDLKLAADLFATLAQKYGQSSVVELYLEACWIHRRTPANEFNGALVLTAK